MRKQIIIYIACFLSCTVFAQDAHHSQYFNLPAYYNPAAAGHDVEHIRLTGMYRRQWPGLETPFITQSILFDKQVSKVGFGALLNKNSAGDGSIQRMHLGGMVSYRLNFHDHQFATGVSIGFIQKRFDPGKMTFDDQYTDDIGYDPSNPTAEQFAFTKVVRPDFSAGFLWSYGNIMKTRCVPYAGASMMHINQPDEVLIEQSNINPRKSMVQAGMRFSCNEKVEIDPSAMMAIQQFSTELMFGAKAVYKFDARTKVESGIYIRNKESVIAYAGYQWNSLMVGVSYDAGISKATSGPAAFEISLTYIPKAKAKKEKKHAEKPAATEKKATVKKPETKTTETKKTAPPAKTTPAKDTKATTDKTQKQTPAVNKTEQQKPVVNKSEKEKPKTESEKTKASQPVVNKSEKEKPKTESEKTKASLPVVNKSEKEKQKSESEKTKVSQPASNKSEKEKQKSESEKTKVSQPASNKSEKEKPKSEPVKTSAPEQKPAADNDNDGVPDVSDDCPGVKGSAATKGCPDSDGDNIADANDKCPNEKGAVNNNGCPPKPEASMSFDRILYFEEHSSVVDRFDVIDILEPVSDILFFDKDVKLVISGFTYEEGDEKASDELSKKRAESVKMFFIENGVPADKIETAGFGTSKPVAADSPEEITRKNRRVEIQIVRK